MHLQQPIRQFGFLILIGMLTLPAIAQDDAAENADAADAVDQADQAEARPEVVPPRPTPSIPLSARGHGVNLSADGLLRGTTTIIDPDTLLRSPAANIDVVFVQNGRIIAQSLSGADGRFVVSGLTPQAVYSVIAKPRSLPRYGSVGAYGGFGVPHGGFGAGVGPGFGGFGLDNAPQLYSAFSLAVLAPVPPAEAVTAGKGRQFASLVRLDDVEEAEAFEFLKITMIPARDLAAVGLPQMFPPQPNQPFPPGGGAPAPGGGGGGGGSGGGAGGLGALGAAAAAAAAASGNRGGTLASPFMP